MSATNNTVNVIVPGMVVRYANTEASNTANKNALLPRTGDVGGSSPDPRHPSASLSLIVAVPTAAGMGEVPVYITEDTPLPEPGAWISVTFLVAAVGVEASSEAMLCTRGWLVR